MDFRTLAEGARQRRSLMIRIIRSLQKSIMQSVASMDVDRLLGEEVILRDSCMAKLKESGRAITPALLQRSVNGHYLHPILEGQYLRIEKAKEANDVADYFGPFKDLTLSQMGEYFQWRESHRGGDVEDWIKFKERKSERQAQKKEDESLPSRAGSKNERPVSKGLGSPADTQRGPHGSGSEGPVDRRDPEGSGKSVQPKEEVKAYRPGRKKGTAEKG